MVRHTEAGVAREQAHHRRQVATGAVAANRNAAHFELGCVLGDIARRGEAVFHRAGELRLGRQPVRHGHDQTTGPVGERPAKS